MIWLVKNGCGIICIMLAWLLMAFSQYVLLTKVLLPMEDTPKKYINLAFFEFFFILTLVAHLRVIFTDPGSVPRKTATPELLQQISSEYPPNFVIYKCHECCSVKPDRAHHCSVCKRCIRKMDHHCPWVNNCVGERNQKFFILFILFVSIISFHALFLTGSHFQDCFDTGSSSKSYGVCSIINKSGQPSPTNLIMIVFLTFVSLLFSLFSLIMLFIQLKAVWCDSTGIENLKNEDRSRMSGCQSIRNVFGDNVIYWLSPFTKTLPREVDHANATGLALNEATSSNCNCPV